MLAKVHSGVVYGVDAYAVEIEASAELGQLPPSSSGCRAIVGELALSGEVRRARGVLSIAKPTRPGCVW